MTNQETSIQKTTSPPLEPQPASVQVNDSRAVAHYANFCRLSGMPEELLLDFGLNLQSVQGVSQQIVGTQKVVTGWHTAKRLAQVLQITLQRHEAAFGPLELDVQKRIRLQ